MEKVVIDMSMSLDGLAGADTQQQYLASGLVDEIRIHLIPVLLAGLI